jgi:hypothetical protein
MTCPEVPTRAALLRSARSAFARACRAQPSDRVACGPLMVGFFCEDLARTAGRPAADFLLARYRDRTFPYPDAPLRLVTDATAVLAAFSAAPVGS